MEIQLKRERLNKHSTLGTLTIDGVYFCDTLEDKVRRLPAEAKIYGKTAIPAGTYKVCMHDSPKFKRKLPMLLDVPFFTNILIHRGNTVEDTMGCILVGKRYKEELRQSTPYEIELCSRIMAALKRSESVSITII